MIPWENIWSTAPPTPMPVQGGDANEHVSHVADAGVADRRTSGLVWARADTAPYSTLTVPKPYEHRHPRLGPLGQEHHPDADDAVGAQFHQHPGMHHAHRGGRRHVPVGGPGMERPQARQHPEPHHEQGEEQSLEVLEALVEVPRPGGRPTSPATASIKGKRRGARAWPRQPSRRARMRSPHQHAAGHQVQSTSFSAPYSLRRRKVPKSLLLPHTPMRRYMGSTASS